MPPARSTPRGRSPARTPDTDSPALPSLFVSQVPKTVTVTESSSRDGLQSLGVFVPTSAKVSLIDDLAATGLRYFDAVSFVSPKVVPQMADASEVMAAVTRTPGLKLGGLVPNLKGLESALAAGVDEIGVLTAASDTFNQRNINATTEEAMGRIEDIIGQTPDTIGVRGYISTATHCPYEGIIDPGRVAELAETLAGWGVDGVYLGETLGKATPPDVERLLDAVLARVPKESVGVHFHDTYGQAIANTVIALERGIDKMDSSAGGLGGCPFAPGAAGNVATEDLLWLLDGMGIGHGVDGAAVADVAYRFCNDHNLAYNSKAGRALLAAKGEM